MAAPTVGTFSRRALASGWLVCLNNSSRSAPALTCSAGKNAARTTIRWVTGGGTATAGEHRRRAQALLA